MKQDEMHVQSYPNKISGGISVGGIFFLSTLKPKSGAKVIYIYYLKMTVERERDYETQIYLCMSQSIHP